jgi:hypothetical protein
VTDPSYLTLLLSLKLFPKLNAHYRELFLRLSAMGSDGRSNSSATLRDPHLGHLSRSASIETGNVAPLVHTRLSRSSRMLAVHRRIDFSPSRCLQAQRAVIFQPPCIAWPSVSIMIEHSANAGASQEMVVNAGAVELSDRTGRDVRNIDRENTWGLNK